MIIFHDFALPVSGVSKMSFRVLSSFKLQYILIFPSYLFIFYVISITCVFFLLSSPIKRIFCESEYVVVHLLVEIANVKQVVIDLFRIENSKIAEHWDAIQQIPKESLETCISGKRILRKESMEK